MPRHKTCIHDGCSIQAIYNIRGEQPIYCKKHSIAGMINTQSKRCIHDNCSNRSYYNYVGETKPLYCKIHSHNNMINVSTKNCVHNGCRSIATYRNIGESKLLYCKIHSHIDMINTKKCIHEGCNITPYYNYRDTKKPLYCNIHRLNNMVNVRDKHCIHDGCPIMACYNYIGEKNAIYCKTHSRDNMINVRSKHCAYDNCYTRIYIKGEIYCNKHYVTMMTTPITYNTITSPISNVDTDVNVNDDVVIEAPMLYDVVFIYNYLYDNFNNRSNIYNYIILDDNIILNVVDKLIIIEINNDISNYDTDMLDKYTNNIYNKPIVVLKYENQLELLKTNITNLI